MASETRSPLKRLECPNCGAPIDQFNATSQSLICETCGSHVSLGMEAPELLGKGTKLPPPPRPIKIGDKATIANTEYMVLGRVMYRGVSDGEAFTWNEWLLGGSDGQMLWLSLDEKGFGLFRKIRFRGQFDPTSQTRLDLGDKTAIIHERYPAQVLGAEGELTWRAKAGDRLFFAEGAGKGLKYSIQQTPEELEIHEGRAIGEVALANAFKNPAWIKTISKLEQWKSTYMTAAIACVLAGVVGLILALAVSGTGVEEDPRTLELSSNSPSNSFSINFETERPAIVGIQLVNNGLPENSFIDFDVNIISPDGLKQALFVQELWHETGVDEDGRWVESQYSASEMFVPQQVGEHKLEVAYDGTVLNSLTLQVTVRRDHIMSLWFMIYGIGSLVVGVVFFFMSASQKQSHN